jgi:cytochrome c556
VAHRQAAFKQILKSFEPMGVQLRTHAYDPERFTELASALAAVKDGPWTYFGPDTRYPPSKAKPALWEEPETFAAKRDAFLKAVDRLAAVAPGKNEDAVRAAYQAVQDSCRDCHKRYKE